MEIKHEPLFNTQKIVEHYTKKDGVDVKYVCTSALSNEEFAMDIFYRETPHPDFGNKYFGLYVNPITEQTYITNADVIEDVEFGMVEDSHGDLHYSSHRHDYKVTDSGNMIDGGRAYIRTSNGAQIFKIKDGNFIVQTPESSV